MKQIKFCILIVSIFAITLVAESRSIPVHVGEYPGTPLNKLQSLPGAPKVLYLKNSANHPILDSNALPISQTVEDVWVTFQIVSAAFSMFNVNVTTDSLVYKTAGVTNSGIANMDDRVDKSFTYEDEFGTTKASQCFRSTDGYATGRSVAHELGHLTGSRDCNHVTMTSPFMGLPEYQWIPMMGNYLRANRWTDPLLQWSKGEYAEATLANDYFAAALRYFTFREDDIPEAIPLVIDSLTGEVVGDVNFGQIVPNTDKDEFVFEIFDDLGSVDLVIDRIEHKGGAMLDVKASIFNENGIEIVSHNPKAIRSATLNTNLGKGKYKIVVEGGAEGTPENGFSNYSSMGFYSITGSVVGGVTGSIFKTLSKPKDFFNVNLGKSLLTIKYLKDIKVNNISIVSTLGKSVFSSNKKVDTINMSKFSPGIYLVRVEVVGYNQSFTQKIIKR